MSGSGTVSSTSHAKREARRLESTGIAGTEDKRRSPRRAAGRKT
jgi:hypothetical protein